MKSPICYNAAVSRSSWLRLCLAAFSGAVLLCLSGCITTAVILLSKVDLPPACNTLTTPEQALKSYCGGYRPGNLVTNDVNTAFAGACPLTNFARNKATWDGLPELIALGAMPERCSQAPLHAMAVLEACPDFSRMKPATLKAVRWLAEGGTHTPSAPVVHMLSCPSAQQAGLTKVVEQWVAQDVLSPDNVPFSVLSALHPSSLRAPWVATLIASGHRPDRAIDQDASAFERALAQGDVDTLRWWTAQVPYLVHRVPAKTSAHAPWLPLARVMSPQFAADDGARAASAMFLLSAGADPQARIPGERSQTVVDYTQKTQPQLVNLLAYTVPTLPSPAAAPPKAAALMSSGATPEPRVRLADAARN